MPSPTCPINNNYKQEYLAIKYDYDTTISTMTDTSLSDAITNLDAKLEAYETTAPGSVEANILKLEADISGAFHPISQYYSNLVSIKKRLNDFIECSSGKLQNKSMAITLNQERYSERANPEATVMPRELVFGFFSELRPSSVPIVLAAGVFMSCLSLLIIFQMFGFTGEIHMPPALTKVQADIAIFAASSTPFYQNPMILSGLSIVLGALVIIMGVMYYRSKK